MRKFLLPALAAATVLMSGIFIAGAAATVLEQPVPRSPGDAAGPPVRIAGVVCGNNGCAPAQTSAPRHRRFIPLGHG